VKYQLKRIGIKRLRKFTERDDCRAVVRAFGGHHWCIWSWIRVGGVGICAAVIWLDGAIIGAAVVGNAWTSITGKIDDIAITADFPALPCEGRYFKECGLTGRAPNDCAVEAIGGTVEAVLDSIEIVSAVRAG
jgi:hypothetical protein